MGGKRMLVVTLDEAKNLHTKKPDAIGEDRHQRCNPEDLRISTPTQIESPIEGGPEPEHGKTNDEQAE